MSQTDTEPDTNSWYDDPEIWPEEGEFADLVNYLRSSTNCAAIAIHSIENEHAAYWTKLSNVPWTALNIIQRDYGFQIWQAGSRGLPHPDGRNSWVADGFDVGEPGEKRGWVEFARPEDER